MSLATAEAVALFASKGGTVDKIPAGANSGIRNRDWKKMVRGERPDRVVERTERIQGTLRLRIGFGEK
jgi:hypothetical protein